MNLETNDVIQIASTIWEVVVGRTLYPDASGSRIQSSRSLVACIQITGAWDGAILLDCPIEVARQAAANMFNIATEQTTLTDWQDSIAELVNMLGGSIKAMLPETCLLSLPSVVEGSDYSTRVPGSRLLQHIGFRSDGEFVSIAILERANNTLAA